MEKFDDALNHYQMVAGVYTRDVNRIAKEIEYRGNSGRIKSIQRVDAGYDMRNSTNVSDANGRSSADSFVLGYGRKDTQVENLVASSHFRGEQIGRDDSTDNSSSSENRSGENVDNTSYSYTPTKAERIAALVDQYDSGVTDVIVFASGTIESPNVTKIVRIDLSRDIDVETKRSNLYAVERKGIRREVGEVFIYYHKSDFVSGFRHERNGSQSFGNNDRFRAKRSASEAKANRIVEFHVNEESGTITTTYANGEVITEKLGEDETSYSYTPTKADRIAFLTVTAGSDTLRVRCALRRRYPIWVRRRVKLANTQNSH